MTNPTPPLTAEAIVRKWISFTYRTHWLQGFISDIEAYAAQQNAELMAENKRLNEMATNRAQAIELYSNDVITCANRCKELEAENERLKEALKSVIEVDKTIYKHHEPRPDGRLPKENGGTIWFTPKEIAKMVLPQSPKEGL